MASGISAGDDDHIVAASAIVVLFVVAVVSSRRRSVDLVVAERAVGISACGADGNLLLVGGCVGGYGEDLALDGV